LSGYVLNVLDLCDFQKLTNGVRDLMIFVILEKLSVANVGQLSLRMLDGGLTITYNGRI
jgi:hypothetical protein